MKRITSLVLFFTVFCCSACSEASVERAGTGSAAAAAATAEEEARSLFRRTMAHAFFGIGRDGWSVSKGATLGDHAHSRLTAYDNGNVTWYFNSGDRFSGDFGKAYEGILSYTLGHSEFNSMGHGIPDAYDVILRSDDLDISIGVKDVVEPWVPTVRCEVPLTADKWEHVKTGEPVSRLEFVEVLSNITSVRIRGGFYVGHEHTWISQVKIIEPKTHFELPEEKRNPELLELCAFLGLTDGACDPYLAHLIDVVMSMREKSGREKSALSRTARRLRNRARGDGEL